MFSDIFRRKLYAPDEVVDEPGEDPTNSEEPEQETEAVEESLIPKTRREKFLAKIAGSEISIQPKTRMEKYLAKIAENGVPGGGGNSDEGSGSGSSDEGSGSGSSDEDSETGGGCFKVNFTQNSIYDVGWMSDKSMAQIIEAYEAGMLIYAELTTPFFDQKSVGILDTLDYSGDSNSPFILCRFKIGMLNSNYNSNNGESLYDEFVMWKILKPKDNEEIIES